MVLPLGPVQYDVISAESDLPGPRVIPAGESETTTYRVPGGRLFRIQYYVEPGSDAVAVENSSGVVEPRSSANISVRLSAPPELGYYRRYVDADDEAPRESAQVAFRNNVKEHLATVANKYVRPAQGTTRFAFVFVPSESVYHYHNNVFIHGIVFL